MRPRRSQPDLRAMVNVEAGRDEGSPDAMSRLRGCNQDKMGPFCGGGWGLYRGPFMMVAFVRRFALHYDIYRRYPLARLPSIKNAWRIART
jgi:hypothetical protein